MFVPHSDTERDEMLATVGVEKIKDLFHCLPTEKCFPELDLPPALTEMEAMTQAQDLCLANDSTDDLACFLGAGSYNHYIPAGVDSIIRRGEFLTAYTPYQPEVSQGTLQAMFEYQSVISSLTGMDVSNASHYDGATATAEAGVQAYHSFRGKRKKIVLSPAVHPHYRDTLKTYMSGLSGLSIVGDEDIENPLSDPSTLYHQIDDQTALVVVQYPDFFGRVFDYSELVGKAHEAGALVAMVTNPTTLALLKPPGDFGADFAVGDGQPLGIPISYGGPYLGFFATNENNVRKIAGRLVGSTVDKDGKRGYVLTLTAREQHIRRERATSNICSNQGLMALTAVVYLSLLGKHGLPQVAELCYHKAHYAAEKISSIPGYDLCYESPFFHEFAVCCPGPVDEINAALLDHGILGGYNLENDYPSLKNTMLIAVTEMNDREDIDLLCEILKEISND